MSLWSDRWYNRLGGLGGSPAKDLTFTAAPEGGKANTTRIFAFRDGVQVGVVSVSLYDPRKYPLAAAIQYVYVPEEFRKTGVAIALLREARRWTREQKPHVRYLLAKALWTGSDKALHDAYGPHLLSAGEKALPDTPRSGDWEGVRDSPGIEYVWWIKVVDKSPGKGLQEVFGPAILTNPKFGEIVYSDFTLATEYRRGRTQETIRMQ